MNWRHQRFLRIRLPHCTCHTSISRHLYRLLSYIASTCWHWRWLHQGNLLCWFVKIFVPLYRVPYAKEHHKWRRTTKDKPNINFSKTPRCLNWKHTYTGAVRLNGITRIDLQRSIRGQESSKGLGMDSSKAATLTSIKRDQTLTPTGWNMKDQVRASGIEVDFTGREGDDL